MKKVVLAGLAMGIVVGANADDLYINRHSARLFSFNSTP